ncbi:MAG TPA: hypothetical protein VJL88_14960 [Nitrospira sp.]|nr:hypothetical protein [Nitrospira sp.]
MTTYVYNTMAEAVDGLRRRGFTTEFAIHQASGQVTAGDRSFNSDDLTIVEHHRFEGLSDPDDSSVVYALEAPNGLKGVLVDAYGAYANSKTDVLLKHMKDRHAGVDDTAA